MTSEINGRSQKKSVQLFWVSSKWWKQKTQILGNSITWWSTVTAVAIKKEAMTQLKRKFDLQSSVGYLKYDQCSSVIEEDSLGTPKYDQYY